MATRSREKSAARKQNAEKRPFAVARYQRISPSKVRIVLNVIRGNWALVTVVDIDRTPKTGYIRWRSDDGVKYLFPDIK